LLGANARAAFDDGNYKTVACSLAKLWRFVKIAPKSLSRKVMAILEEYKSFANFFLKLKSLIIITNAELWPNATKIIYVRNAFNNRLRAQLIGAFYENLTIYSRFVTKCEQFSSQMEIMGI
jgi:hypothetical protein